MCNLYYIYLYMSYFKKHLELLEYMKKPLSIESIELLYNANNVRYENAMIYSDFSVSLTNLITTTYLGDDLMSEEDREKHFNWCWDKVNENFKKEQIELNPSNELKLWYFDNFDIAFYNYQDKEENTKIPSTLVKFFKEIFNIQCIKTRAEVDVFIEVYKLFTQNLFNKKTV